MSDHISIIDLNRTRGDDHPFAFQLFKADGVTVEPVTGFVFKMTADPNDEPTDSSNNFWQLTGVVTDGPNGKFHFLPSITNMDLPIDTHFYDVQMIDGGAFKRTPIRGKLIIEQDITKV